MRTTFLWVTWRASSSSRLNRCSISCAAAGSAVGLRADDLDRDGDFQLLVPRLVDRAHAADAEQADDVVAAAEFLAHLERVGSRAFRLRARARRGSRPHRRSLHSLGKMRDGVRSGRHDLRAAPLQGVRVRQHRGAAVRAAAGTWNGLAQAMGTRHDWRAIIAQLFPWRQRRRVTPTSSDPHAAAGRPGRDATRGHPVGAPRAVAASARAVLSSAVPSHERRLPTRPARVTWLPRNEKTSGRRARVEPRAARRAALRLPGIRSRSGATRAWPTRCRGCCSSPMRRSRAGTASCGARPTGGVSPAT